MLTFVKKYSVLIIFLLVIALLAFFIIPKQEVRYLTPDLLAIRKWSRTVVLWSVAIMVVIAFIFYVRWLRRISELFYLLLILSWISFCLFAIFNHIIIAGIFFVNQLSGNITEKVYRVEYIDQRNKQLRLYDSNALGFKIVSANHLLNESTGGLRQNDRVVVSFSKGLFGFNFDPVIKVPNH